ncbi:MAG TPA: FAD-dependent oxidoreductase, partial [Candidatus Limnocylindria bacterium]|nr:FAD-dependent oxidoreductase [Candidatus Limnocylindria bacterium]
MSTLWLADPAPRRGALETDARADVAVVGGGIAGVATAYFLARRGASVVLLEREHLGVG